MELKKAKDIMIPLDNYPHMPYWFSIRQAIIEMDQFEFEINDRKSLPRVVLVFNESYELLGYVRRRDILRGLEPELASGKMDVNFKHVDELSSNLPFSFKDFFEQKKERSLEKPTFESLLKAIEKESERPVSDIMNPIKTTVDAEDNIVAVVYLMVENDIHILPVLEEGEIIGVVRTVEVLHEVKQLLLSE